MVSKAKRDWVRAIRLWHSWPLWYAVVGLLGLLALPITYFIGPEAFLYGLAFTSPLLFLAAMAVFFGAIALVANLILWLAKLCRSGGKASEPPLSHRTTRGVP